MWPARALYTYKLTLTVSQWPPRWGFPSWSPPFDHMLQKRGLLGIGPGKRTKQVTSSQLSVYATQYTVRISCRHLTSLADQSG